MLGVNGTIVGVGVKLRMKFGECSADIRVKRFHHAALCHHHPRAPFPNVPHRVRRSPLRDKNISIKKKKKKRKADNNILTHLHL